MSPLRTLSLALTLAVAGGLAGCDAPNPFELPPFGTPWDGSEATWPEGTGYVGEAPQAIATGDTIAVLVIGERTVRIEERLADGTLVATIPTELGGARSIDWHPDGYYLVAGDYGWLHRIGRDGATSIWSDQSFDYLYQTVTSDSGETVVADEYTAAKMGDDGRVVTETYDQTYCWMDTAEGPQANGDVALFDVYGPGVATWSPDDGTFTPLISGLGYDVSMVGRDGHGTYYAGGWGGALDVIEPDGSTPTTVALGEGSVRAIEALDRHQVVVLQGDWPGTLRVVENHGRDGVEVRTIATSSEGTWQDIIVR